MPPAVWIARIPSRVRQTCLALSWFGLALLCPVLIGWSFHIADTKHFLWRPQPGQHIPWQTRVFVGGLIPPLDTVLIVGLCIFIHQGCATWQRRPPSR